MPTIHFSVEGTTDEKLTALCALCIQQQGYLNLLTILVTDLYARANNLTPEIAAPLIDQLLPGHIATAAEDFRQYGIKYQITKIQEGN